MPDFYSNDGAWPMRFRATYKIDDPNPYDTVSSIGVILHYYEGPSTVSLFACDPTQPAASNCTTQVVDPDGNNVVVPNTGTLRLQMRAPDNDSVCDHHVRLGYHKMFTILSSSYNQQYSFIEPAKGFNSNGTGQFEDSSKHACFDEDQRLQDQGLFIQSQSASPVAGSSADAAGKESGAVHSMISVMLLNSALAQLKDIMNREHELQSQLQPAIDNINAASEGANKLEGFPKISSVRQVESHLNEAVIVIEGVRGKPENHLPVDVIAKLLNVETVLRILADRTKNGADCRAPLVLVQ